MGASEDDIARLIRDFGALRKNLLPLQPLYFPGLTTNLPGLLRTSWTEKDELPNRYMTALEIAIAFGRWDLVDILMPEIGYPVSHFILKKLQTQFHELIRESLHARPHELANLKLPDLLLLTELELPVMWFPLKSEGATEEARMPGGYDEEPTDGAHLHVKQSNPDQRNKVRVRPMIPDCPSLNLDDIDVAILRRDISTDWIGTSFSLRHSISSVQWSCCIG